MSRLGTILSELVSRSNKTYLSPSNSTKNIASDNSNWQSTGLSVTISKGVWLLVGEVQFASNATGKRGARWNDWGSTMVIIPSGSGGLTSIQTVCVTAASSPTTITLNCYQNSGSSLSVTGTAKVVKIGEQEES